MRRRPPRDDICYLALRDGCKERHYMSVIVQFITSRDKVKGRSSYSRTSRERRGRKYQCGCTRVLDREALRALRCMSPLIGIEATGPAADVVQFRELNAESWVSLADALQTRY